MRPELRREIERWFLRRGVPQLVAGYTSERQLDNRAAPEIGAWSLGRLQGELFRIVGLLSRTLPVLLILVLFLMFASEIWEAANGLSGVELTAILALIAAIAVILVLTGVRAEMSGLPPADWAMVEAQAADTPAAPLLSARRDPTLPVLPMTFRQRVNVTALPVIGQVIQSLFVALIVMAFLLVFGLVALPGELQGRWIGEPPAAIVEFSLFGELRTVSYELVAVTAILGSVVGLYFTGLAVNDAAYRPAHFGRLVDEVRPLAAAHAIYRAGLPANGR